MHLPGRMAFGKVQFGEIVVVGLDIGTFRHREAHVGEDGGEFVDHLADRMHAAGLGRRLAHRQGDVDRLAVEPRVERARGEFVLARGDCGAELVFQAVDRRALHLALVGRHRPERLQERGDRAALAERCDAHGLERCLVLCRGDGGHEFGFKLGDVGHGLVLCGIRHMPPSSWPGLSRPSRLGGQCVPKRDARDKPAHDNRKARGAKER